MDQILIDVAVTAVFKAESCRSEARAGRTNSKKPRVDSKLRPTSVTYVKKNGTARSCG